ncbi:MAG: GntR family transcriptional regulator [Spirochaetaceae bacterium]|nr:GntR family transcriptional regulator [Spirochaetaceae bacterium]
MEFNQPKGIYQQIAEQVRERIAGGEWNTGDRIPSVREMAVTLGVNPNTVTRSYQSLLENTIIENRRGIGYFVAETARERVMEEMKDQFIGDELPKIFKMMRKMEMEIDELISLYKNFNQELGS